MLIRKSKPKKILKRSQYYHGHVRIELRETRTGSRERIEHDNDFTLGINKFLRDGSYFNNSPFANQVWRNRPMYQNLIGGILLFDKTIEAVDGGLPTLMPAGTKMVANGSYGVANNGSPTELGSFNSSESSANENAITMVYDWPTQHACNIECVSLTSDIGGYVGYGNSVSQVAHATTKSLFENQNSVNAVDERIYWGQQIINNKIYWINQNAHSGNMTTFNLGIKNAEVNAVSLFEVDTTVAVEIPTSNIPTGTSGYILASGNGCIYVLPNGMTANKQYRIGVYEILADTWSYIAIVPNVEITGGGSVYVTSSHLWYRQVSSSAARYKINLSTGTIETYSGMWHVSEFADGLVFATDDDDNFLVYDEMNDTLYKTNGSHHYPMKKVGIDNQLLYHNAGTNVFQALLYRNPLYLATINNLDEPVTKTTTQTMKVTYTVTPA